MIVGFAFHRVSTERKVFGPVSEIRVTNDVDIKEVTERPMPIKNRTALGFTFQFTVKYEPGVGEILMDGEVVYLGDAAEQQRALQLWKEKKKVSKEISVEVINTILHHCNVKALEMAQDVHLPSHIPLPKVAKKETPKDYIG